jgi:hypothetical protein
MLQDVVYWVGVANKVRVSPTAVDNLEHLSPQGPPAFERFSGSPVNMVPNLP